MSRCRVSRRLNTLWLFFHRPVLSRKRIAAMPLDWTTASFARPHARLAFQFTSRLAQRRGTRCDMCDSEGDGVISAGSVDRGRSAVVPCADASFVVPQALHTLDVVLDMRCPCTRLPSGWTQLRKRRASPHLGLADWPPLWRGGPFGHLGVGEPTVCAAGGVMLLEPLALVSCACRSWHSFHALPFETSIGSVSLCIQPGPRGQ